MQHPETGVWKRDSLDTDEQAWESFAKAFNLKNQDQDPDDETEFAPLAKKSIYFMPTCDFAPPIGPPGPPENWLGIFSDEPVLVE
jgi:hypothetical protein